MSSMHFLKIMSCVRKQENVFYTQDKKQAIPKLSKMLQLADKDLKAPIYKCAPGSNGKYSQN